MEKDLKIAASSKNNNKKSTSSNPSQKDPSLLTPELLERACSAFGNATKANVLAFNQVDTLNPHLKVSGYLCKQEGSFLGSLYITHVNSVESLPPQLIFGTPKIRTPFEEVKKSEVNDEETPDESTTDKQGRRKFIDFPKCHRYVLLNKWNGTNILIFKYVDDKGNFVISAKPRMTPFITNGPTGNLLSMIVETLSLNSKGLKVFPEDSDQPLPKSLKDLTTKKVQSITFELCGNQVPHLVKYDFQLALKPLFLTYMDGRISPILSTEEGSTEVKVIDSDQVKTKGDLERVLEVLQDEALTANIKYRESRGLSHCYWYDHFIVEGHVLYLVDEDNFLINRDYIYKIKPKDIELFHWEQFDERVQTKVLLALQSIFTKDLEPDEKTLKAELDMSDAQWQKWSKDILELIVGVPNPKHQSNTLPRVLILVGLPGSGKSTIANELVKLGWERVNQDEMGTRKVCEQRMDQALSKGKSVVVDRCNFDITQRRHWFKLAAKYGATNFTALSLNISPDVCKQRIAVRKDHPTIAEGSEEGPAIIDRFKNSLKWPEKFEGFREITTINDEQDPKDIALLFALEGLQLNPSFKPKDQKGNKK